MYQQYHADCSFKQNGIGLPCSLTLYSRPLSRFSFGEQGADYRLRSARRCRKRRFKGNLDSSKKRNDRASPLSTPAKQATRVIILKKIFQGSLRILKTLA